MSGAQPTGAFQPPPEALLPDEPPTVDAPPTETPATEEPATETRITRAPATQAAAEPPGTPEIYLHIGTMKSGTSYIQGMLWRNRGTLRSEGVLYPGNSWQDQVTAVRDVIEADNSGRREIVTGAWETMRDTLVAWPGAKALISMELMSVAAPDRSRAMVESLAPADVHVVITARDLARVIPSAWQESTQNRQTWTWPAYLSSVTGESDTAPAAFKRFWRQHDVAEIARQWGEAVREGNVHIVIVPRAGAPRDELWRRFCSVVGLDAGAYAGAFKVRGNPAVGAASAEFLRRLNVAVGRELGVVDYELLIKRFLAKRTLAHRASESRLVLPARYHAWAVERARQMITAIEQSGADVVGDVEDLMPEPAATDGSDSPEDISEEEVAEAGLHAVEALVLRLAEATQPTGSLAGVRSGSSHAQPDTDE